MANTAGPPNAMTIMSKKDTVIAWYRPVQAQPPRDIAQEAYVDAVEYLKKELDGNDKARKWVEAQTSVSDIRALVDKAKATYETKSAKRKGVHKWLNRFSSRITYYGQVLDMLAQHHPEYVALAWGAVKFVLMGILEHANLVTQLSKALAHIGNVLPRTKLNAELYQTDHMKGAISGLYAHIILFFQQAVKWYNMGPASRALQSILKPFDLEYKDTVEQIKICSETVEEIASAAARAEIRDMNITVQLLDKKLQERDTKLQERDVKLDETYRKLHNMQEQLKDQQLKIDGQVDRVYQVVTSSKSIAENIQLDVSDMKPRICDIQLANILNFLSPRISPEDLLQKCRSLAIRRQSWSSAPSDSIDLLRSLGSWLSTPGPSLLVVRAGPRAEARAKDFAVDVINHLQSTPYKVIWTLSQLGSSDAATSTISVLKSLVYQALRQDPDVLSNHPDQLNITRFQADHTEAEWAELLCLIFSRFSKCFVVVETEDLFRSFRQDPESATRFLQIFQHIVDSTASSGSLVKILVVSFGKAGSTLANASSRIVTTVQQPPPVPPRLRRPMSRRRGKHPGWQSLRPRF